MQTPRKHTPVCERHWETLLWLGNKEYMRTLMRTKGGQKERQLISEEKLKNVYMAEDRFFSYGLKL